MSFYVYISENVFLCVFLYFLAMDKTIDASVPFEGTAAVHRLQDERSQQRARGPGRAQLCALPGAGHGARWPVGWWEMDRLEIKDD